MQMRVGQIAVIVGLLVAASTARDAAGGQLETSAEIIAAHIRQQGYACRDALNARRDGGRSKPNEQVWLLNCGDRRYRVRLTPDMGSQVQRLDWQSS
jgi:hypothetical protein